LIVVNLGRVAPFNVGALRIGKMAMAVEIFNRAGHFCVLFTDLVGADSDAVQANQCLIIDDKQGMLLDPGGQMTYNELYVTMTRYMPPKSLKYVFASHADPDVIASLQRWLNGSETTLLISRIWSRFVPHFCNTGSIAGRMIEVPDRGGRVRLGGNEVWLLPAHFLHSEGNFQVYDPVSRILFSGDVGASMVSGARAGKPVTDFDAHVGTMSAFHRRYMVSRKACQLWAKMASGLDIEMIVPQHGAPIRGQAAVGRFIEWLGSLECGIDLMTQDDYRAPLPEWRLDAAEAKA
jgi:flavorubredoxin